MKEKNRVEVSAFGMEISKCGLFVVGLQSIISGFCRMISDASVAQLDSASVFGTEGWGFESLRA